MEKEFLQLINKHRGIIYKVCNLYGKDEMFRKDLFQDIVYQLWRSFPSFKGEAMASTWMYRVALNTAISQFRKDMRVPDRLPLSESDLEIPDIGSYQEDQDKRNALRQAIEHLTEIEKAIVMLYLEEKSYAEISDIMGITPSNVGVKLTRIRLKLEKIIKEKNYEY